VFNPPRTTPNTLIYSPSYVLVRFFKQKMEENPPLLFISFSSLISFMAAGNNLL